MSTSSGVVRLTAPILSSGPHSLGAHLAESGSSLTGSWAPTGAVSAARMTTIAGCRRDDMVSSWIRPYFRPPIDNSTASGRVAGNSENTIARIAVIGTARNAPAMPQSSDQTARLTRMANGLRFSELPIT